MKKIISLLMALIFVFSMATPSFAAVAANDTAVQSSVVNDDEGIAGANNLLGQVVEVVNSIWTRIVDFFKSIFGFGFRPGTYNVIYYTDETKTVIYEKVPTLEGDPITPIAIPTRVGYTFKSWLPALPKTMPGEDVEVYATWSLKTVTISFVSGVEGVKPADIKTTYGSTVTLPTLDEVDNKVLIGWEKPSGDVIAMPGGTIQATDDIVLTAKWGVKATTITFNPNGGYWNENPSNTAPYKITQSVGQKVTAPADPTRAGYKFEGWDGVIPSNQPSADVKFTAVWTPLDVKTTWVSKGVTLGTQTTKAGSNLSPKVSPVPDAGFRFVGWRSSTDGITYENFPIATPSVATTFTAVFEAIEYNYTFLAENGKTISSGKQLCGSDINVPAAPAKTGHTFIGWVDATDTTKIEAGKTTVKMQAGDATYTAKYTANVHKITWNASGGTIDGKASKVVEVAYGTAIEAPVAVNTGYNHDGWTPAVPATMPDEDLSFTAVWTEAGDTAYTVETYTMGIDGEYSKTSVVKNGLTSAYVEITPEEKEGFTLNETSSVLSGKIAADGSLVLKIYYDRNKYNVTVNGETNQYYFGETFKAPAAAEKEGNTFKGWRGSDGKLYDSGADVTVPAIDDFELVPEYDVNKYTVTFYTQSANSTEYTVWHSAEVAYGAEIIAPAPPSVTDMYFEGWNQDKTATTAESIYSTMPAHALTYYAVFSKNVDSYTVTFDANGGKFPDKTIKTNREVYRGQPINLPKDAPSKANTRFLGWAYDKDATEAVEIGVLTEAKDITIYAVYGPITCEVKFNYKDIDGTVKSYIFDADTDAATDTVVYTIATDKGSVEVEPPVLDAKKGYSVTVWGLDKVNGTDADRDEDGNLKTEDIYTITKADYSREYYCEYVINKNKVVYIGDENCNWGTETTGDGEVITHTEKTVEVEFGKDIIAPAGPNVVADGRVFIGWTADEGKTIFAAGAKLGMVGAEDDYTEATEYTFKAVYDLNKFIIDYDYEGKIVCSEELAFGDTVKGYEVTEEQANPGLVFVEWKEIPEKIDIEAYQNSSYDRERGAYVIKTVALNDKKEFAINFSNCFKDPIKVKYNEPIDAAAANAAPEEAETGYTFAGWIDSKGNKYTFPEIMPAADIEVSANWTLNEHTVTWIVGDNAVVDNYFYDDEIVKPADPSIEGYTFIGWDKPIPSTMPDEDLIFTAVFEVNFYSVTWVVDGKGTTETYDFGETINKPADPSKTGYTFIAWQDYTDGMIMPSNDLTFTAEWKINTHTVTWIVDNTRTVVEYNYGEDISVIADPQKDGYEFTGWDKSVAGVMGDADLTYTATFKACEYEVTFLSGEDHGNVSVTEKVPYGKMVIDYAPASFADATNTDGQYIVGWADLADDFTMPVPAEEQKFEYTALWEKELYNFNFVYGDSENDVINTEANFGDELDVGTPEKEGYNFIGWFDEDENEIVLPMTVEKDYGENGTTVTFVAEWEALPFEAVFNAAGGNWGEAVNEKGETYLRVTETTEAFCGEVIEFPANPVKIGYTFLGWDSDIKEMPAGGVEFTAVWEVKTFTVTFKYGGGKDADGAMSKTDEVQYGEKIVVPENLKYDGYTFSKWSPVVNETLDVESNLEFTAIWVADSDTQYTVEVYEMNTEGVYVKHDDVIKTGETNSIGKAVKGEDFVVDAGQEIDTQQSTDNLSVQIAADNSAVIKVYIARKQFAVYTEVDGVKEKVADYYYGSTVSEPALKEKEGYTFAWEGIPEDGLMPAEDVVIKGVWTVNNYTVTVGNAGKDKVYTIAYGEAVIIPEPTRDGYTFAGWDKELPATMPAKDITVNAKWEKNTTV